MHLEVLKSEQSKIFPKLRNFPEFYLAGGTALALQMGHRISIDFDLFLKNKRATLKDIKEITQKKYQNEFNFRLFLEQLIYLKDIKKEKIKFLKKKVSEKKIQEFFEKEIKKIKI